MTKEKILGLIRHSFTLIGAIVLIYFNDAENLVSEISASLLAIISIAWSWKAKSGSTLTEKLEGLVRHSIAIVTALLIYLGKDEKLELVDQLSASILMVIPFILSWFQKERNFIGGRPPDRP